MSKILSFIGCCLTAIACVSFGSMLLDTVDILGIDDKYIVEERQQQFDRIVTVNVEDYEELKKISSNMKEDLEGVVSFIDEEVSTVTGECLLSEFYLDSSSDLNLYEYFREEQEKNATIMDTKSLSSDDSIKCAVFGVYEDKGFIRIPTLDQFRIVFILGYVVLWICFSYPFLFCIFNDC